MKKRREEENLRHVYFVTCFVSVLQQPHHRPTKCSSTLIGLRRVHDEQKRETKLSARVSHLTAFLDTCNVSLKTDATNNYHVATIPFPRMLVRRWKYNV